MASIGEVIYEDYLYKFTGRSRSILWGKSNPWREKYFILKRIGNKPILEQYNKKPKTKTTMPKGKIDLWPSYRVEKITNMKNRAYVFQLTTPEVTICLSADEQRNMDMFVFFLQLQSRLKDQIRDDLFRIEPENSESHRRIGARGSNCIMHVSPYGITLALESNRAVLAQWPLKSIRSYESSEKGQLSLESGRIAPMGDGLYVFNTLYNGDNLIFDTLDKYVMDNLGRAQPGNTQDLEDYVWEAERLLGLTVVSACTLDNPDVRNIVQTNWNTELQPQNSVRPRPVVHTRLAGAQSTSSLNSQNSIQSPQSLPSRFTGDSPVRNSPHIPRSLPPFQNSPGPGSRRGSNQSQSNIADRPPLPPPSTTIPVKIPNQNQAQRREQYISMNSTSSAGGRSDKLSDPTPTSPFSPSSADWAPPPNFREAMRQQSKSPIAEHGPYNPDAYLLPSPGVTSTPNQKQPFVNHGDQYLTPMSPTTEEVNNNSSGGRPKTKAANKHVKKLDSSHPGAEKRHGNSQGIRRRRLRSMSCEDLSDYLRHIVYDPISKSMSDLLNEDGGEVDDIAPEPFPRLDTYSSMDLYSRRENYYNIEGLQGKVYDGPMMSVGEIRKKFSTRSQSRIRRSVSNPNFMRVLNKEKLHLARVSAGISVEKHGSRSSLVNLLPESIKKHLSKDGHSKGSNTTLSSGHASQHSRESSRASSTHTSPSNSLSRKHRSAGKDEIVASTGVKGINFTKRTRSFRKQKTTDGKEEGEATSDQNVNNTKENVDDIKDDQSELKRVTYANDKHDLSYVNGKGASVQNKKGPPKIAQKPVLKLDDKTKEATTTV